MNRRQFIEGASLFALGCGIDGCLSVGAENDYRVTVLGDLHYDRPPIDVFHANFKEAHLKDGMFNRYRTEFECFSSMWGENGKSRMILESAAKVGAERSAFVMQLGDLIEGDCESSATHSAMFDEAFGLMSDTFGGKTPFFVVPGNHDVRAGKNRLGEYENCRRRFSEWNSRQLGEKIDSFNFAFRRGKDVWIVADFNRPDFAEVERLLLDNPAERYTFFCTHGAVLTNGTRDPSCWFFAGSPRYNGKGTIMRGKELEETRKVWKTARLRLRRLLAGRKAIVLSGHTHRFELKDWSGDGGSITELVVSSVTRIIGGGLIPGSPKIIGDKVEDFGRCLVKPNHRNSHDPFTDDLYRDYVAGMRRYFTSRAAGHVQLRISDNGVVADYHALGDTQPERSFVLRNNPQIS